MEIRRLVLGDIHGRYDELRKLLDNAKFSDKDLLYFLGDAVDRGNQNIKTIKFLNSLKNIIPIRGNHDACTQNFLENVKERNPYDIKHHLFRGENGSFKTIKEIQHYQGNKNELLEFFKKQVDYFISQDNILFIHGGFNPEYLLEDQLGDEFYWNREYWEDAIKNQNNPNKLPSKENFKEIYIGHTPTIRYQRINNEIKDVRNENHAITCPINIKNLWNMDTGAGFNSGYLSLMDIKTKQLWQQKIV